jgi:hypothetical protein
MNVPQRIFFGISLVFSIVAVAEAEIQVVSEHHANEMATPDFKFHQVPAVSKTDAAVAARITIQQGRRDRNGGRVEVLCDGHVPRHDDQPSRNFFFAAGTQGGRLLIDLGQPSTIKRVNTYSWHSDTRGPQVYRLYAAGGMEPGFALNPAQGSLLKNCGWRLLANVDTRPERGQGGGQYGVSVFDSEGSLGHFRYLLFDIACTESNDPFGNTFFSEIDVDDGRAHEPPVQSVAEPRREVVPMEDDGCRITIDTTETPDLTQWAHEQLVPVVQEWYPKIVAMLPSEGFEAPRIVDITFSARMQGVAATSGTQVRCAGNWMRQNLAGEAKGAVVHELVHVVQQYGRARRLGRNAQRTPGWLVEGIADYVRWFLYEPESRGAEISKRNANRARYDASYRVTANFLNWVVLNHDPKIIAKLNAAAREGRYQEDLWQEYTGHSLQELGKKWKASLLP